MTMPIIKIKIAESKTCWWSNIKSKDGLNWRHDNIFAITRIYNRDTKFYIYRLTIGRFTIGVMKG